MIKRDWPCLTSATQCFGRQCTLLRAVFPALRCLRYCDSNIPAMDKVYTLTHRTSIAIEKSIDALNDTDMFRSHWTTEGLVLEETELYGVEEVIAER